MILPLLGHLVPVLQYTLPEHRKTTLGRYRLVARDSRKHQRHKSGKAESSQCSDPPPSPNSDTTTSSIESHSSPAKCRAPLRRAKTVIRVRRGQPEWLANVNEWRRRSTAYSASIVESCQTRIGRMNLTRRSATQMSIPTLSPRSSVSDPTFEPPLSSSSTVTFRDPFQPASLGSSAKSFKECTVPLSTQHPLDPARTYRDMALEQTSGKAVQPIDPLLLSHATIRLLPTTSEEGQCGTERSRTMAAP